MGSNLAAVREHGVLGLRGAHRIGSGATVLAVIKTRFILKDYYSDSGSLKGGYRLARRLYQPPILSEQRFFEVHLKSMERHAARPVLLEPPVSLIYESRDRTVPDRVGL